MKTNWISKLADSIKHDLPFTFNGHPYDVSDRVARSVVVGELIKALDPYECDLARLSDLLLFEELTNSHPDKTARNEYPIISDYQIARRRSGVHRGKNTNSLQEVSGSYSDDYGIDGVNHAFPNRRERTAEENRWMDENTQSKNKEVRRKYLDFINGKSEGVFTVNIATGDKTVHSDERYKEIYGFSLLK